MKVTSKLVLISFLFITACGLKKKGNIDSYKSFNFQINDNASIFKYAKNGTKMYWYSIGGVKKDIYDKDPFFALLVMPKELALANGATLQDNAKDAAIAFKDQTIKNQTEEPINGLSSFEREVYGFLDGKKAVMFQHVVLIDNNVILMGGIADDNFDLYVNEFKKLSHTIKRK